MSATTDRPHGIEAAAVWPAGRDLCHVPFTASPVVVGGCPGSGTQLLRRVLDAHSRLWCGPTSGVLCGGSPPQWVGIQRLARDFALAPEAIARMRLESCCRAAFADRFFRAAGEVRGKSRWADATPRNVRHIAGVFTLGYGGADE